jgi:hypothetical protein
MHPFYPQARALGSIIMSNGYLLGLALVIVGAGVVFALTSFVTFKVNERRFHRRNVAGIEEFPSYWQSLVTRSAETSVMVLARPIKWFSVGIALSAAFMMVRGIAGAA